MSEASVITRFGAAVRHLRFRLGISQEELANRANLHRTYIAGVEGGTRNITLKSIEKLARALEVSIPELLAASCEPEFSVGKVVEILLVEDNSHDVALAQAAFRDARITNKLQVVSGGAEALDLLWSTGSYSKRPAQKVPRVILLDLNVDNIHGLEVLRRLKADARTRGIPVVVLTASKKNRDLAASRRLGAAGHIVKPVAFQDLCRLIPELGVKWALLEPPTAPLRAR